MVMDVLTPPESAVTHGGITRTSRKLFVELIGTFFLVFTVGASVRNGSSLAPLATGAWHSDGEMVRAAYTLRKDDDDYGQAGVMVREVLDDAARARLVSNVAGHLLGGVSEPILLRAFEYWKNIDKALGDRIEDAVRNGG